MISTEVKVNNNNAVIYARYSSDKQNEQSIEGQVRVIQDYAKGKKIPIINSYIDRAISGRSDDRPEFLQMIADAKKRNFGYVLVYKYDRFSRDRLNSLIYKNELRKNGVKVISVTEYISDDPQGILFESIIDGYSEYYSAELAQKVRRGNRESRMKGLFTGGPVIYGYKIIDKKYVIIPEEAEIVKKIFVDILNGRTFVDIINEFNSKGLSRNGKPFNSSFIQRLINNKKYIGIVEVNGETFNNIVPPIIDKELFDKVQEMLYKNYKSGTHLRPNPKHNYLLTGKLICGCCKKSFVGEVGTSKNGVGHHYYKCISVKKKLGPCTNRKAYKDKDIEEKVINEIKYAILHSDYIENIASALTEAYNSNIVEDAELKINETELSRNKKETDNLINVLASGIVVPAVKEKLEQLEEEKQKLMSENIKLKTRTKNKIDSCDALLFLTKILAMEEDSEEYKKFIINSFVRKIEIYEDKINILLFPLEDHIYLYDENYVVKESVDELIDKGELIQLNEAIDNKKNIPEEIQNEIRRFYYINGSLALQIMFNN